MDEWDKLKCEGWMKIKKKQKMKKVMMDEWAE